MRKIMALFSIYAFLLLFASSVLAQVALPDYSGWDSRPTSSRAVHNGNNVVLSGTYYYHRDQSNMREESISVLNDESGREWLILYAYFQHTPDHVNENLPRYHVFEYQNGRWVHVQDFSDSTNFNGDLSDFLKNQYNLVF